jgi:nickel-dependent lactate racemase
MACTISLAYHKQRLGGSIPSKNLAGILIPRKTSPVAALPQAIDTALEQPTKSPPLDTFVRKGDAVVIVVSDLTRYTGANSFLPHLTRHISRKGIPDKDVSIIFALGIHRPMTVHEQKRVVGDEVAERFTMENHATKDDTRLVALGETTRGTPVVLNRRVAEADKVILTGTIGYHYLAGFGGGRKSIIPGVASYDACVATHLLVLDPTKPGRHPQARAGNLRGNPMHEDMLEALAFLPPVFLFNTVLSADRAILSLAAGNGEAAFYEGCRFVDQYCKIPINEKADVVIASCGGFPKDINFIQSHKTLEYAMNALKPGGVMILAAACTEGLGHPDFARWLQFQDPVGMEAALRKHFQINGQTAYATLLKARRARILLLSELPDATVHALSMTPVRSLEEALSEAYRLMGENASIYVIPHGSLVLPWAEGNG